MGEREKLNKVDIRLKVIEQRGENKRSLILNKTTPTKRQTNNRKQNNKKQPQITLIAACLFMVILEY